MSKKKEPPEVIEDEDKQYRITNINTFNRYLLSISTAGFTFIVYAISKSEEINHIASQLVLKTALGCFTFSILSTMLALILMIDDPKPEKYKMFFIDSLDWAAFVVFSFAVVLLAGTIIFS